MATQNLSNVSEILNKSPEGAVKKRERGRPPRTAINPDTLWSFVTYLNSMSARYHVEYGSMQLLCLLHHLWEKKRKGVSVYGIVQHVNWYNSNNTAMLVNQRLVVLVTRGLVEVVGKGRYNCKLYAPTVNALRDMVEMISKLD